jgi:hypothetical protein
MNIKLVVSTIAALLICNASLAGHHETEQSPNETVAVNWLKAQATGKEETIAYVASNLADDGQIFGDRYVGFGFTFNPNDEGKMIVDRIIPNSPAAEILKSGDEFTVVNGVSVRKATMDKLSFRGKPGEAVKATIKRGGKRQNIEVSRGIISNNSNKSELIADLETGNADDWPFELKINEVLSKDNIVYVWSTGKDVDTVVDLPFEQHIVTRFVFNEEGKVQAVGRLSEDRFVLEQTGYNISR